MINTVINAVGIQKNFDALNVLKGINLEVNRGEVVSILGPSGSGKSTFLRCINHLETPDAGLVTVLNNVMGYRQEGGRFHTLTDKQLAVQRRPIGMVFQSFNLFPHLTALENVMEAPVQVLRCSKKQARMKSMEALERVGLGAHAKHYPAQLSGGAISARSHRQSLSDESRNNAIRRADLCSGPRTGC